jgi:hypothetical protein
LDVVERSNSGAPTQRLLAIGGLPEHERHSARFAWREHDLDLKRATRIETSAVPTCQSRGLSNAADGSAIDGGR